MQTLVLTSKAVLKMYMIVFVGALSRLLDVKGPFAIACVKAVTQQYQYMHCAGALLYNPPVLCNNDVTNCQKTSFVWASIKGTTEQLGAAYLFERKNVPSTWGCSYLLPIPGVQGDPLPSKGAQTNNWYSPQDDHRVNTPICSTGGHVASDQAAAAMVLMSWTLPEDWEQVKVTLVALKKALLSLMDQIPKDQQKAVGKNSEN